MARPILHPSDFSSASGPAFRKAVTLAKGMRRPLLIVYVVPPVTIVTGDMYMPANVWDELERSAELVGRRGLMRLPNTSNPDDWAKIAGRKGERIVYIKPIVAEVGAKAGRVERVVTTGQYL